MLLIKPFAEIQTPPKALIQSNKLNFFHKDTRFLI